MVSIHHIELNVRNLPESLEFYRLLDSFFEESKLTVSDNSFSWEFGTFYLYVNQVQSRFANASYHRKGVGLDHIAFRVDGIECVRSIEQFLIRNNIPILYKADSYGPKYFAVFCEDPDRFKLEFGADL